MAKNNINIKIKADAKEAEKGINSVTSSLNKLAKNPALTAISKLSVAVMGVKSAFSTVTNAIKNTISTIKDLEEAYKTQEKAELQLEVAAKHNPYLDGRAVNNLKAYASSLQSISTVGDETLLPMMAELASAGRTEIEIQQIMSAALDASASGAISLDSAVQQLNASYGGSVGQLGKILPSVKNLTKEELASGAAVNVVAEAFKGMAETTAQATGTSEQLANAWGDLKEELGAPFEKAMSPMRKFFTNLISSWTSAIQQARLYKEATEAVTNGTASASQQDTYIEGKEKEIAAQKEQIAMLKEYDELSQITVRKRTKEQRVRYAELTSELDDVLRYYRNVYETEEEAIKKATQVVEAEYLKQSRALGNYVTQVNLQRKAEQEQAQRDEDLARREELREDYKKTIDAKKEEIDLRRKAGEEISQEKEAQELMNAAISAYVSMYKDPAFDRSKTSTGMWEGEQAQRDEIQAWGDMIKAAEEYSDKLKEIAKLSETEDINKLWENLNLIDDVMLNMDEDLKNSEIELWQTYANERMEIEDKIAEYQKTKNEEAKEALKEGLQNLQSSFTQLNDVLLNNIETNSKIETAKLDEQYNKGLISYEEYEAEKSKIEKKSAMDSYKINLANWTMSLATATANVAEGVTKALSAGYPLGIMNGALLSAAGAVQIGALIANKPIRPSFATGGIVGATIGQDNTIANVRTGEMILNANQQLALWKVANGGASGGLNQKIIIQNTISDRASASVDTSDGQIRVLIRDYMREEMGAGTFDAQINSAKLRSQGERYL